MNKEITNQKRKVRTRVIGRLERLFLEKKLNNWVGVLLFTVIAVAMGLLLARDMVLGMGVFGGILGLAVIIACLLSTETGFYVNMACSFFVYHVSRLFFSDQLPVGVITDVLIVAMLFSLFIKGSFA